MKLHINRYDQTMLMALSQQPLPALLVNSLLRAVLYVLIIQAIALTSGLPLSSPLQMLVLLMVFGLMVLSVDIIEKYIVRAVLSRR